MLEQQNRKGQQRNRKYKEEPNGDFRNTEYNHQNFKTH